MGLALAGRLHQPGTSRPPSPLGRPIPVGAFARDLRRMTSLTYITSSLIAKDMASHITNTGMYFPIAILDLRACSAKMRCTALTLMPCARTHPIGPGTKSHNSLRCTASLHAPKALHASSSRCPRPRPPTTAFWTGATSALILSAPNDMPTTVRAPRLPFAWPTSLATASAMS